MHCDQGFFSLESVWFFFNYLNLKNIKINSYTFNFIKLMTGTLIQLAYVFSTHFSKCLTNTR